MKIFNIYLSILFTGSFFLSVASDNMNNKKPLWSILICTLEERVLSFDKLYKNLQKQIEKACLEDQIEVLYFLDNREKSIGYKRNWLLAKSKGEYVSCIDDDDAVHDNYIGMIYEKLLEKPDCISLTGIISYKNEHKRVFIHSLAYTSYYEKDQVYYRPPNHLNPIKRSIAIQFLFPENNYGEDTSWAMQLASSGLLQKEAIIDEPYYFYLCSENPLSRYF